MATSKLRDRLKAINTENYQVDDGQPVNTLTEEEAKLYLCEAIDLIELLDDKLGASLDLVESWRTGRQLPRRY